MSTNTPLQDSFVFKSLLVGDKTLSNRVVYCPTTRFRAAPSPDAPQTRHVPLDLMVQYYSDRAQYPGTLLVTEATLVSDRAGGYDGCPKISTKQETKAWKKVVDAVHSKGSFLSCQFWFLGRVGIPSLLKLRGLDYIAPSPIYESENIKLKAEKIGLPLREVTEQEIHDIIYKDYTIAAQNAIAAGFDFIELHGAHGYFIDQFLHECSNQRTDKYGGSIENRCRFVLELIDHLTTVVGAHRLALRLSPWAEVQGIVETESPIPTFAYLIKELQKRADQGKQLAYLSVVEPRVQGTVTVSLDSMKGDNKFVEELWEGILLRAGNYTYDAPEFKAIVEDTSNGRTLVGFSRFFTSNPDLVLKLQNDPAGLVKYNRKLFYAPFNWGYNTYGQDGPVDEEAEKKRLPKPVALDEAKL
jgi:NADPH2 dehydrogenase